MAKKMFSVIETDAFAIQFMDGSFYNGLDGYLKRIPGAFSMRTVPYRDRVRASTETLRTFKTSGGAAQQVEYLKRAGLSCDVIPVRIGIFPR